MNDRGRDILLLICPPWDLSGPPLALGYLAAALQSRGIAVEAWDLNIRFFHAVMDTPLRQLWAMESQNTIAAETMTDRFFDQGAHAVEDLVQRILDSGFQTLGFSVHCRNAAFTERLVHRIRQRAPKLTILYGGPEVSVALAIDGFRSLSADGYVVGEGEQTLPEVLERRWNDPDCDPIPGFFRADRDTLQTFVPRPPLRDLDSLPFPDWDQFPLFEYHPKEGVINLPFLLSRGCIGRCSFCTDHGLAGRHRVRSAANAVEEIRRHVARYGVRFFGFNDLICDGSLNELERFCDRLIEADLDIQWWSYAVVRKGLTESLFRKMRASGCVSINFGLESGSDRVLERMNKFYDTATAQQVLRDCTRVGIPTSINIIVGFPGETQKEHHETIDFLVQNKHAIHSVINLSTLMLTPGSDVHRFPDKYGILVDPAQSTWHAQDGNTLSERNRRLFEIRRLLGKMHIPISIINIEPGSELPPDPPPSRASDLDADPSIRLVSVTTLDAGDREAIEFETGGKMTLRLCFRVEKELADPMVRVQITNSENPKNDPIFVFGTNTDRFGLHLGALKPGDGEIRLVVQRLNLAPGAYHVAAGLWPEELAPAPYHEISEGCAFVIAGKADLLGYKAALPARWRLEEKATTMGWMLRPIELLDTDGRPKPFFLTDEPLLARVGFQLDKANRFFFAAFILDKGYKVFRSINKEPIPFRRGEATLEIDPITLLEGVYHLILCLIDPTTGNPVRAQSAPFEVRNRRWEGAGLVFLPCAWEFVALPRSQPSGNRPGDLPG